MAGGISSSAAAEHRLAAEWTAKLAAENRRKLQGGRWEGPISWWGFPREIRGRSLDLAIHQGKMWDSLRQQQEK